MRFVSLALPPLIVVVGLLLAPVATPALADAPAVPLFLPLINGGNVPSPALPKVRIAPSCSQFDAPGDDNHNLNEEYVCFQNDGSDPVSLAGWRVGDETAKTYTFPPFTLLSKASVRLHTGSGVDAEADLYWNRTQAVWNNTGDTVYLYDAAGALVDTYAY